MTTSRLLAGVLAAGAAASLVLTGCGPTDQGDSGSGGAGEDEITFGMFNFDELIAITNLWSAVLKDEGYGVSIESADKAPVFQGLADGTYDSVLSIWEDADRAYLDQYGDHIVDMGTWNDEAALTIAVNADASIDSLEQLAEGAAEFDNEIYGIEAGAALTGIVEDDVIPAYGLEDMELVISSTPAMLTQLDGAMSSGNPIAVTLWRPHWAYGAYDLKDLEDPEGTLGEQDSMNVFGSTTFAEDHPEVAEWLGEFEMGTEMLHDLENHLFNENEASDADMEPLIREWMSDNQEYVDSLTS